jgi:hypothetical protein
MSLPIGQHSWFHAFRFGAAGKWTDTAKGPVVAAAFMFLLSTQRNIQRCITYVAE